MTKEYMQSPTNFAFTHTARVLLDPAVRFTPEVEGLAGKRITIRMPEISGYYDWISIDNFGWLEQWLDDIQPLDNILYKYENEDEIEED